jgi:hypothetical protein
MGLRIKGTSVTVKGNTYGIEIHDEDFSGTPIEVAIRSEGFNLSYDHEDEDPATPILSSALEFGIIVVPEYRSALESFALDLIESDETRFAIKVTRGISETLFWAGFIIADNVEIEDYDWAGPAGEFRIKAIDGIGRLEGIEYKDGDDKYEGRQSLTEHLFNVLGKIGLDGFWGASDVYLRVVNRFFNQDMSVSDTLNPFDEAYLDHSVFHKIDAKGNIEYANCYEVLKSILQPFLCRFYISNGIYRIAQATEWKTDGSIREHRYDKSGTKLGTDTGLSYKRDENTDSSVRVTGTRFLYFPPVRLIELSYGHLNDRNLTPGAEFQSPGSPDYAMLPFYRDSKLWFRGKMQSRITTADVGPGEFIGQYARPIFAVKVVVQVGLDTYRLKREASVQANGTVVYSDASWSTDPTASFVIALEGSVINGQLITSEINFVTPTLPSGGPPNAEEIGSPQALFNISGGVVLVGTSFLDPVSFEHEYSFFDSRTTVIVDDVNKLFNELKYRRFNQDNPNASEVLEYETKFGDAHNFGTSSSLTLADGTYTKPKWTRGTAGSGQLLQTLFVEELMKIRKSALERLEGQILGEDMYAHHIIKILGGREYALLRGTYNSRLEVWDGVWQYVNTSLVIIAVDYEISDVVSDNGVQPPQPPGPPVPPKLTEDFEMADDDNLGGGSAPEIFIIFDNGSQPTTTTSEPIGRDDTVTQIPINPTGVDGLIQSGDEIAIYDPITGLIQIFTVTSDVMAGDTFISVASDDADFNFTEGSVIVLPTDKFVSNIQSGASGGGDCLEAFRQKFAMSGGEGSVTVTANGGVLPDAAFIDVHYNGVLLCPSDDWQPSGSDIVFQGWEAEEDSIVTVRFWASSGCKNRYVETFSLTAGQTAVTVTANGGVLPSAHGVYLSAHLNGILKEPGDDYSVAEPNVNLNFAAESGDKLTITFWI